MKKLFFILICSFCTANHCQAEIDLKFYPYASIGLGYKIEEPDSIEIQGHDVRTDFGGRDSFSAEIGVETNYNISIMFKHESQVSTGWPVNDKLEYYKTEIMVKYKWGGKP